jgi:8-oxo-dGTP pyrophosphatase MutT (NUDIX family)
MLLGKIMMVEEKTKWKKEISAGGVVYKKENGSIFVLMIMPMGRNYGPPEGYWTWPKGKMDEGEEKEATAVREVNEETGVEARIVQDLGYIKFFKNQDKVIKFVHFFLMEYLSGDLKDHDREVAKVEWVDLIDAEARLKWPHDKEVFERAKKALTSSPT